MLDTRTNDLLSRLQGNGPNLVSFLLAALIVVELAALTLSLVKRPVKSPQPTVSRSVQPHRNSGADVQSVVSAHLFGVATIDPATQDPANAPLSSANLVLAGTIATQDPKRGIAIISDGGPSKVYAVGENVAGASLHSVYLDHVILDRAGVLETLLLPRLLAGSKPMPAAMRHPGGGDPRTVAAVDNIRRMVQQDPGLLDQVMRTVPSYDNAAGKLRGFRAYPGRNRAIFNKLGLKPGDLVTAINGTVLDDPQHSQEVFNTIQSSDHVTVTVERGGQKQEISLNIAQVAAQATKELEGGGDSSATPTNPAGAQPPPGNGGNDAPTPMNSRTRVPTMPITVKSQHRGRTALASLMAVVLMAVSLPIAAQPIRSQEGATITPNYKDADLSQIIQAVSEVTGKNFIIDPRVNAKVTMLSTTPMSPAAFYEAFLAVLQVYGYVAVPAGKVIKIIPNTDARQGPSIDLPNDVSATSDEIVTQIITMKNISATQLVPMLRPLIPQQGHLAAFPSGNMLIISDRASNVNRIMRIVERMDESGDEPVEVIPLHNASATELVRTVNLLSQGQAAEGAGAPVKVVADERTNSVLISGEKSLRLKIKALIVNLDTPTLSGGDTQVRYLRYADAEKIADKLKGQASASAKAQGGPQAGAAPGSSSGANVDASVTIWADVATNALIITAPPKIMKSLMAVIDKLDIRRAQVQVEAIIVEVDVNKSSNLGVQWILYGQGGTTVPALVTNLPGSGTSIVDLAAAALSGGLSSATSSTTTGTTTGASALSSSTLGTGATLAIGRYNATSGTNFAAIVQALRSDGTSNIISTPSLITMNNEEAEVKVTQEIPLITGSYTNSTASVAGTTSPFETIQREEVGTILKVTPHINEGNSVQLKIEQEDSSPGAKLTDSADISTNKRSIKTTVLIEDGGIIVLGGLMSDTVTESEDRVPVLGAIPLLGNLFKSRSGSRQKKNLLVFIRPKILRDADATESISESKYNDVRQSEKTLNHGKITLLPGEKQPSIPAIPQGLPPAPPSSITNPGGATPNPPATMPQAFPIVPPTSTPAPILPMPGTGGASTGGAGDKTAPSTNAPAATAPPATSPAPGTSP